MCSRRACIAATGMDVDFASVGKGEDSGGVCHTGRRMFRRRMRRFFRMEQPPSAGWDVFFKRMDTAFFIVHMAHEGPGLAAEVARELGYRVETVEAYAGAPLPHSTRPGDLLVVMGGSMGVGDLDHPQYPWLRPVAGLLRERLEAGLPSLGICLGCQLLAYAAGGKVFPMRDAAGNRMREVGWGTVVFNAAALGAFPLMEREMEFLHWHGDACELPPDASLWASSEMCGMQMFSVGRSVGIQFHPEVDSAMACEWAREDAAFVRLARGAGGVEEVIAQSHARSAVGREQQRLFLRVVFEHLRHSRFHRLES
jgi:GMP synthase (glutamine-hydrolysing)